MEKGEDRRGGGKEGKGVAAVGGGGGRNNGQEMTTRLSRVTEESRVSLLFNYLSHLFIYLFS